ncbi:MAG: FAD-dependent oxidoreductase [Pseudomonadales bacterium]|nr:FAD-dependent oxidoreductase [Pseudomonadales bacterium]
MKDTYDVVVVGSGAGAFMAALAAVNKGASVLMIEKGNQWGGTSSKSGGAIWIPNSKNIAQAGVSDSPEDAFKYMRAVIPASEVDDETIKNYIKFAPEMTNYLEANTELTYTPVTGYADYYPDIAGWKEGGRTMDPSPVDGRQLPEDMLSKIVDSPRASKAFSKFQMSILEGVQILAKTPGWIGVFMSIIFGYYKDIPARLKGLPDRRLCQGNALVSALYLATQKKGVDFVMESAVTELTETDGKVTGVVINGTQKITASKGVVIAAGGFEHNKQMRDEHISELTDTVNSSGVKTNTGDLHQLAKKVGAGFGLMSEAWWAPTAMTPFGPTVLFSEKSKPGLIIVDKKGQRFMNESITYNSYGDCFKSAQEKGHDVFPAYCILDSHYRQKYMFGGVVQGEAMPDFMSKGMIGDDKMLIKADTLEELAGKIGVDYAGLQETMAKVKKYAASGKDEDFGRGSDDHDTMYGDPEVKPNACWGPMDKGPYYATKLLLGDLGTKGGMLINHNGQVKREDGSIIEGLYAAGNATSSIMGSKYPGAGCTLGPAMTIAYKAGHHIMGAEL